MQPTYEEMAKAAEVAAAKVCPRSHLGYDELYQEAWKAILECRRTYDSSRGVTFGAYAYRAGLYACQRAHHGALRDHVRQAQLEVRLEVPEETEPPDKEFDRKQWRDLVKDEVRKVLLEPGVNPEAIRLVLQASTAKELAVQQGKQQQTIYNDCWQLRRRLKESPTLQRLWSQYEEQQ